MDTTLLQTSNPGSAGLPVRNDLDWVEMKVPELYIYTDGVTGGSFLLLETGDRLLTE
jgi:hypothetical protein